MIDKTLIFDIEGTITDIHFVSKILFPYAREHMPDFLRKNYNTPEVSKGLEALAAEMVSTNLTLEQMTAQLDEWMAQDAKIGVLKYFQGLVWRKGYYNQAFQGHVYSEVKNAFAHYKTLGAEIYIYSSGSVEAQKLLLQNSIEGDLTQYISGYFDTTIGSKLDTKSYLEISNLLNKSIENCIFFSDNQLELVAAREAGMQVFEVNRNLAPQDIKKSHKNWTTIGSLNGFVI